MKKDSSILGCLFRVFKSRGTAFLCKLYSTYVLPVTDYASVVYHPHSVKNMELSESVRKQFTRRLPLFFHSRLPCLDRIRVLGLDALEMRMLKCALCFAYNLIFGHVGLDVDSFFSFPRGLHGARTSGLKLNLESCESDKRQY